MLGEEHRLTEAELTKKRRELTADVDLKYDLKLSADGLSASANVYSILTELETKCGEELEELKQSAGELLAYLEQLEQNGWICPETGRHYKVKPFVTAAGDMKWLLSCTGHKAASSDNSCFLCTCHSDDRADLEVEWGVTRKSTDDASQPWKKTCTSFPTGSQFFQFSNFVTSGSFGDQTFGPGLAERVGESLCFHTFEASFKIGATTPTSNGARITVSPDDGSGGRMSFLAFNETLQGIEVTFFDTPVVCPIPVDRSACPSTGGCSDTDFNGTVIGMLSYNTSTMVTFVVDVQTGPDVVKIYFDGVLVHTGTSWENYYRGDQEQNGNCNQVPQINTLIWRVGGDPNPGVQAHMVTGSHGYGLVQPPSPCDNTIPLNLTGIRNVTMPNWDCSPHFQLSVRKTRETFAS
eukprot:g38388.t1